MTTSSAPGKIILFGEHAVVYGRPALAVPVTQVQATATVSENSRGGIWIEAPNINLSSELSGLAPDHPLAAVINSVFSALSVAHPPACTVYLQSTIPVASGLGSGAAVSVAIHPGPFSVPRPAPVRRTVSTGWPTKPKNSTTAHLPGLTIPSSRTPSRFISSKASQSKHSTLAHPLRS